MAQPGDTIKRTFRVYDTATAAYIDGLDETDFTFLCLVDGVVTALSVTVAAVAATSPDVYLMSYALPSGAGGKRVDVYITPDTSTYRVEAPDISGEAEANDLDSLAVKLVRASGVALDGGFAGLNEVNLTLFEGDWRNDITVQAKDADGEAIDYSSLSLSNHKFFIQGASTVHELTSVSFTAATGTWVWSIAEDHAVYDEIPAGQDQVVLPWSLRADVGGNAAQSRTFLRGFLTILRTYG